MAEQVNPQIRAAALQDLDDGRITRGIHVDQRIERLTEYLSLAGAIRATAAEARQTLSDLAAAAHMAERLLIPELEQVDDDGSRLPAGARELHDALSDATPLLDS